MDIKCPFCNKHGRASIERLPKRARCPKCSKDFLLDEGLSRYAIIEVCNTVFISYNMDPICEWPQRITEQRAREMESALDRRISWRDVLFAFSDQKNAAYGNLIVLTHSHLAFTLDGLMTREVVCFSYKDIESVEVGNLSYNPCGERRAYVNGQELSLSRCNPIGFQELLSKISLSTRDGWEVRCYKDIERLTPEEAVILSRIMTPAAVPSVPIAPSAYTGDLPPRGPSVPVGPAVALNASELANAPTGKSWLQGALSGAVGGVAAWLVGQGVKSVVSELLGADTESVDDQPIETAQAAPVEGQVLDNGQWVDRNSILVAENDDIRGVDNDGDGHTESTYVKAHERGASHVQSFFRKNPNIE